MQRRRWPRPREPSRAPLARPTRCTRPWRMDAGTRATTWSPDGRPTLEQVLGCRVPWTERLRRAYAGMATVGYLGALALVTAMVLALPLWWSADGGTSGPVLLVLAIVALVPASDIAVAIVNWLVTHLVGPRPLPSLELVGGCAVRAPDARRGPDAPCRRGGHRGAGEPPGGPLPGERRTAICASHCSPTGWTRRANGSPATRPCWPRRSLPSSN